MGNCKLGGKHWRKLWDNEAVRQSLIEESERLVFDQNEALVKAFYELYSLQNVSYSSFMQYLGMLERNTTLFLEIQKSRQEDALGEDRLQTDRERMAAHAEAARKKRENR